VFNFHPHKSYENYKIGTYWSTCHFVLFDTDEERFGGHNRLSHDTLYDAHDSPAMNRRYSLNLYIPSRCGIALIPTEFANEFKDLVKIPKPDLFSELYIEPEVEKPVATQV